MKYAKYTLSRVRLSTGRASKSPIHIFATSNVVHSLLNIDFLQLM